MTAAARILVVDDDPAVRELVRVVLADRYSVLEAPDAAGAFAALRTHGPFDLILLDLKLPGMDGLEVLHNLLPLAPGTPVIMITANPRAQPAIKAMKLGARAYLLKPFDPDELRLAVHRVLKEQALERELDRLRAELPAPTVFDRMIGSSPAMQRVYALIRRLVNTDLTALVQGETGTGKELVARALHYHSRRRAGPFLAVHCAAIPSELLESELFGHEKGAFTGALQQRIGLFEAASGGTLFLDEIGEMPLGTQSKLLRVLEDRGIRRVGGQETVPINTRVVCATHRDLAVEAPAGRFRADLYYRINVVAIGLPALRERREDLLPLLIHFAHRLAGQLNCPVPQFTPAAVEWLMSYSWPGNVRQLEHGLERLLVISTGPRLGVEQVAGVFSPLGGPVAPGAGVAVPPATDSLSFDNGRLDLPHLIERVERRAIEKALGRYGGVLQPAARSLCLTRRKLRYKMHQLGISQAS